MLVKEHTSWSKPQIFTFSVIAGVALVYLLFRSLPLSPFVFADELHYSILSRLQPIAASSDPDYLYLLIYRLTNHLGDFYLQGGRILNVFFFSIGIIFIYLTARMFAPINVSVLIALGSLLSPISSYTSYFMPETLYFCFFWVLTYAVLASDRASDWRGSLLCGVIASLLSIVKPHAFFLLPALALFFAYKHYFSTPKPKLSKSLGVALLFIVAMLAVRLILGFLIAGQSGLSLFGHRYASQASESPQASHLLYAAYLSALVLFRHVAGLCLMFGLPLAIIIDSLLKAKVTKGGAEGQRFSVTLYTALVLISLVIVTSVFTVTAVGTGPFETLTRFHNRYYNFCFPLFFVVAACRTQSFSTVAPERREWKRRFFIAGLLVALTLLGVFTLRGLVQANIVDSPEFWAFSRYPRAFFLLSILQLGALLVWIRNTKVGAQIFLYLLCPVFLVVSLIATDSELRGLKSPDIYARAGIFTRDYLSQDDRSRLTIVGPDMVGLYKSIMYIDNLSTYPLELAQGKDIPMQSLRADTDWVLLIGKYRYSASQEIVSRAGDYTLLRLTHVDFSKAMPQGGLDQATGLSPPETAGAWSIGKKIVLLFTQPLPKHFMVQLGAVAFGPNANQQFLLDTDTASVPFSVPGNSTVIEIPTTSDGVSRQLVITVPQPTSPKELGESSDNRQLGLMLETLRITP